MRLNLNKMFFVLMVIIGGLSGGLTVASMLGVDGAHLLFFVVGYTMFGALALAIGWSVVSRFFRWLGE